MKFEIEIKFLGETHILQFASFDEMASFLNVTARVYGECIVRYLPTFNYDGNE